MSGHINNKNGTKIKTNERQNVTTPVWKGDSLPCLIDSGSSLSIIPLHLAKKFHLKICNVRTGLSVTQTQGILALTEKCYVKLKTGHMSKNIELFVLNNSSPYALIGLPQCQAFNLNINCSKMQIFQNNKSIPIMDS